MPALLTLALLALVLGALIYCANLLLKDVVDARFLRVANILCVLAFFLYAVARLFGIQVLPLR